MLTKPMDILSQFPVRKNAKQKQAFRNAVIDYAKSLGYQTAVEKGSFGSRNLVIGDPENAKFLVTAHYDTCARLPVPNLVTPCNFLPFMGWQILLTLILVVIPLPLALLVGLAVENVRLVGMIWYLLLVMEVVLMLVGPANPSNVNDNTSGVVTALEIACTLPEACREKVCFVLFDLEEAGLLGSASYRRRHKKVTEKQIVINLDCVGDGDHIRLFPTGKLKKDKRMLTSFYKACGYFGKKDILVHDKGFSYYPSDQKNFPYGMGVAALNNSKFGLYVAKIHTPKDTVLDITNVNLLRAALTTFLTQTEG